MQCPVDQTTLVMTSREGIEIDYCPQCRGVWLDRGELDKLIDRSGSQPAARPVQSSAPVPGQEYFEPTDSRSRFEGPNYRDDDHRYRKDYDKHHGGYHKRKKENFLSDLFDF